MAKSTNGHDVQEAMLQALLSLRKELVRFRVEVTERQDETNLRLGETNTRLADLSGRVGKLEMRVDEGFKQVNKRIDNFVVVAGQEVRDHRERLERLEAKVFATQH